MVLDDGAGMWLGMGWECRHGGSCKKLWVARDSVLQF